MRRLPGGKVEFQIHKCYQSAMGEVLFMINKLIRRIKEHIHKAEEELLGG